MSVPNQKKVQVAPRPKRDKEHLYAMMNIDALQTAMRDLKGSALKMWLYFNKNQDRYQFELSQKACVEWGIKKDSYYDGVRELEAKGYLLPIYEGSNIYNFYETPPAEKPKSFSEKEDAISDLRKNVSDFPQRNNTNNTNIIKNNTLYDDNAKGVIVDCGKATIPKQKFENRMQRWLDANDKDVVCQDPNAFINKYF